MYGICFPAESYDGGGLLTVGGFFLSTGTGFGKGVLSFFLRADKNRAFEITGGAFTSGAGFESGCGGPRAFDVVPMPLNEEDIVSR